MEIWNGDQAVSQPTMVATSHPYNTGSGVITLTDGTFVVAYTAGGVNGADNDVYVRHYDTLGRALGPAQLVHSDNAVSDTYPVAVALPNGGYAVAWLQNGNTVLAQKFLANDTTNGGQIVIATDAYDGGQYGVGAAAISDGTMLIAYSRDTAGEKDIVTRTVSPVGAVGSAAILNTSTTGVQDNPIVVARSGDFLVMWNDENASGDLVGRFVTSAGAGSGAELQMTSAVVQGVRPDLTWLANGNFLVTYGTGVDTKFIFLNSSGGQIGTDAVLQTSSSSANYLQSAALPGGGFVSIYYDGQTKVQHFDERGNPVDAPITLPSSPTYADWGVAALPDGRVVAIFEDAGSTMRMQILDPRDGSIQGNNAANTIYGNPLLNDSIAGLYGNDILYGMGGDDILSGNQGNDRIYGGDGNDTATFSRTFGESSVVRTQTGSFKVSNVTDGTDILKGVERLAFSDKSLAATPYARSDVNGDGDSDILTYSSSGGVIARFDMQGGYQTTSGTVGSPGSGAWDVQATGDFTYDGNADVVMKNVSTGQFYIWTILNGTQVGGRDLGVIGTTWDVRSTGDFNADGAADILWRNSTDGHFYVWTFNASAVQTGSFDLGILGTNWDAGTAGDFDGDGDGDVLLRNSTNGQIYVYEMQNGSIVTGHSIAVPGSNWTLAGTGDYNGDGYSDIAVKDTTTGQFYIYQMKSGWTTQGSDLGVIGTDWFIAASGDYNADGTDDILWRNASSGQAYVWTMDDGRVDFLTSNHLGFLSSDTLIV
jgi:hypothetical protein